MKHGIDYYPPGTGIGHQVMVEEGYAFPNTLTVASDSHSNMYGGVGCLGTPVVRTDAASIWITGSNWWQIPRFAKVIFTGALNEGITGKDVIVTLCGIFNKDQVLNHAIEFDGPGVASLSIDDRLTIANMTTEWGALSGVFPVDQILINWLSDRAKQLTLRNKSTEHPRINNSAISNLMKSPLESDSNAKYNKILEVNLSTIVPHVSGPNSVKIISPVTHLQEQSIRIDKAYLISCTNSRSSDIRAAASVLRVRTPLGNIDFN